MTIESLTSFEVSDVADDESLAGIPPSMVCIPGGPALGEASMNRGSPFEIVSTPTTSVGGKRPGDEKVGRWTEEEHNVFLEGLKLYGKQWKTIATMIGTRTVVQVRTHAQKYFQKLERKNRDNENSSIVNDKTKAGKRKSLPASMPSRKKPKSPKKSVHRSASLSLSALSAPPSFPNPMSASSASISSENLSTVSPVGVMDFDPNTFSVWHHNGFKDEHLMLDVTDGLPEDPLEWLLDGDIQCHLPESSIEHAPMFPDFSNIAEDEENGALTLQAQSGAFDASLLDSIVDPKVTVQSLFLDGTL